MEISLLRYVTGIPISDQNRSEDIMKQLRV